MGTTTPGAILLPAPAGALALQATTGPAGYALINGTGNIPDMTWTAPADGQVHYAQVFGTLDVTATETGGQILVNYTAPNGVNGTAVILASSLAGGVHGATGVPIAIEAGSTVTVAPSVALSAGGPATVWLGLFGL
jgi:hypothetical protein